MSAASNSVLIRPTSAGAPADDAKHRSNNAGKASGLVSAVTTFFSACAEGLAAERRYEALRRSGVPHARAAAMALAVTKDR